MTPSPSVLHIPVDVAALIQSAMAMDGSGCIEESEGIPVAIFSDEAIQWKPKFPAKLLLFEALSMQIQQYPLGHSTRKPTINYATKKRELLQQPRKLESHSTGHT